MLVSSAQVYLTAILVGLLGGVHCLTMCGGLVSSFTLGLSPGLRTSIWRMLPFQILCNLGRVGGYVVAGAIFGGIGAFALQLGSMHRMQLVLYALAGITMTMLGLYLAGWSQRIAAIERLGLPLWQRLQPLVRKLLPISNLKQALAVGFLWAWLPCGLVYSVLITAVSTGSPIKGAAVMLAFGIGTLPNLLGIGLLAGAAARLAERMWVRRAAGLVVMLFGLAALWQAVSAIWG